jgi:hypothetical protein
LFGTSEILTSLVLVVELRAHLALSNLYETMPLRYPRQLKHILIPPSLQMPGKEAAFDVQNCMLVRRQHCPTHYHLAKLSKNCNIMERHCTIEAISFSNCNQALRSKRSFCINVQGLAFAATFVHRQLACNTQLMT